MNQTPSETTVRMSGKNKDMLVLLSAFLGALGVDRFYRGQVGLGDLPTDATGAVIVEQ